MYIFGEQKVGEWQKVHGYCTAGGDPVYQCPNCRAEHVYGIEHPDKQERCSVCCQRNLYPWEIKNERVV